LAFSSPEVWRNLNDSGSTANAPPLFHADEVIRRRNENQDFANEFFDVQPYAAGFILGSPGGGNSFAPTYDL